MIPQLVSHLYRLTLQLEKSKSEQKLAKLPQKYNNLQLMIISSREEMDTVYLVSGLPQPLRSGLDLPKVCAPESATIS